MKRARVRTSIDALEARAVAIAKKDAELPLLPKGLGSELIRALHLEPGPAVGQLMAKLEQTVKRGELPPRAEAEVYIAFLRG
jgi:hypothetical protein